MITDPPYNVNYEGSAGKIKNDNMGNDAFYHFLFDAFTNTEAVMANDASIYVFHADTEGELGSLCGCRFLFVRLLHLEEAVAGSGALSIPMATRAVLYGWKKTESKWYTGRKETTIWELDKPKKNGDHPTMKPVPLLAYPIMNSSMSNTLVLDPFGGSGSTLIACEQSDRSSNTIELDEKFCDVIVKRYIEQVGSSDKVSVQRDGVLYSYADVAASEDSKT